MIFCETCKHAHDECELTRTPIEYSVLGITVMPDCPLKVKSDYETREKKGQTHDNTMQSR